MAAGVPLASRCSGCRRRARCPTNSRGVFSYIAAKRTAGLDKEEMNKERACLAQEFYSLPQVEQDAWRNREEHNLRHNDTSGLDPDEHYSIHIADKLWGLSSRKQPITEPAFKQVITAV